MGLSRGSWAGIIRNLFPHPTVSPNRGFHNRPPSLTREWHCRPSLTVRPVGRRMMTGCRLALVADDQRLAGAIQAHLKKALGQGAFQCTFESIRTHLNRDTDCLLLLATGAPAESEQILRLVQEIYLQRLPPIIMIAESETLPPVREARSLDHYVARRLRWPDEAHLLVALVRERLGRVRGSVGEPEDTVEDVIRRRLLAQTPSLMPLVERIAIASAHDVTVLLSGETGTGKTFLARL